jgi:hypothetical protein
MREDIKKLVEFLDKYGLAFQVSSIFLDGEDEDAKMWEEIESIKKKYHIK